MSIQTIVFEVANLVNERPIGRHPTDPEDGVYLCPNNMLLGRATTRVPSGPWKVTNNPRPSHQICSEHSQGILDQMEQGLFPIFDSQTEMAS